MPDPRAHDPLPKIFPRNLTARAAHRVVGNPDVTRLESAVGNCYPGLEFDQRNLDRRFFPGLVFEFSNNGVKLLAVDRDDLDLAPEGEPRKTLDAKRDQLGQGQWVLAAIEQGGKTIALIDTSKRQDAGAPINGMTAWRLVRGLEPGPVKITLRMLKDQGIVTDPALAIELEGKRRTFVDPETGVIVAAYRPGELTQSLCSPWQHDFRDCGCHYWASNHPDVVLGEDPPGVAVLPSGSSVDPRRAEILIDWLRDDRNPARTPAAQDSIDANRPFQMDHYEINARWQELAVVVAGKEIPAVYVASAVEKANPLGGPQELACRLFELAKLEHVLALEYLYAYFSVKAPDEPGIDPRHVPDLKFIRHHLLTTAISEMLHLRWVNQMLWGLFDCGLIAKRLGPSLRLPKSIPDGSAQIAVEVGYEDNPAAQASHLVAALKKGRILKTDPPLLKLHEVPRTERYGLEYLDRPDGPAQRNELTVPRRRRALRALDAPTLDDFIAVEEPSGGIDGQYTTVTATFRLGAEYPDALAQIASRIVTDGEDHYNHFRDIALVLKDNGWDKTLEHLRAGPGTQEGLREAAIGEVGKAKRLYRKILNDLAIAYREGDVRGDRFKIAEARKLMADLEGEAEALARDPADPKGIPFFEIADDWARHQGSDLPDSCPPRSEGRRSAGAWSGH